MSEIALADRICAAAQAWKDDGEVLATGIGIVPRLAASLVHAQHQPRFDDRFRSLDRAELRTSGAERLPNPARKLICYF